MFPDAAFPPVPEPRPTGRRPLSPLCSYARPGRTPARTGAGVTCGGAVPGRRPAAARAAPAPASVTAAAGRSAAGSTAAGGRSTAGRSAPGERAGTASGLLNSLRQTGGALSVAVFGALLAGPAGAFSLPGMRLGLLAASALLLATAALALFLPHD